MSVLEHHAAAGAQNAPRDARFWDRIAERYAGKPVPDEAVYREKLRITQEYLGPDAEVFEFGCGTGTTAIAHAPHVRHVLATDISARMIEIAGEKARAAGVGNVTFRRAGLDEIDSAGMQVDAVLGHSILHLLRDRDAAIARVHAMLKPGGVFVSSTACLGDWLRIFRLIGPVGHALGLLPLVRVFTRRELESSLTAAGFAIERSWLPKPRTGVFIVARKAG